MKAFMAFCVQIKTLIQSLMTVIANLIADAPDHVLAEKQKNYLGLNFQQLENDKFQNNNKYTVYCQY